MLLDQGINHREERGEGDQSSGVEEGEEEEGEVEEIGIQ